MLDEWEENENNDQDGMHIYTGGTFDGGGSPRSDGESGDRSPAAGELLAPLAVERPIFAMDTLERNASKGHGAITSAATGFNTFLVGTSRGWLVRYDFNTGESVEMDLNTGKGSDMSVSKVFMDPTGRHALIATRSGTQGPATFYLHARWRKPALLARFRGLHVTAVAWNRQQFSDSTTRDIVVGTLNGELYETSIEERDRREKNLKLLYSVVDQEEPFCGLQMETVGTGPNMRFFVMAVTPTRMYVFAGNGSLETVFAAYAEKMPRFTELPGDMPQTEIHFFGKHQRRSERFAWLAGAGIYHGHLNLGGQIHKSGDSAGGEEGYVENKWLLDYGKLADGDDVGMPPLSMAVTEYHFLLLYKDQLKVVNRVSQSVVEGERFGAQYELGSEGMLGLCTDTTANVFYAYSENSIYEISAQDEERDMWRVHLERKEYATALGYCKEQSQRDSVYAAQAEEAFSKGEYNRAATFYAKTSNVATFEEVALKFVGIGEQDALRTFLLHRLDHLGKEDRAQVTMIATWAAELYLDKINRLLPEEHLSKSIMSADKEAKERMASEYESTVEEFRAFLSDCKDVLDEATTVKLLGSYGQVEELIHFATLKEHHETVIQHHIQRGNARAALAVLRKPGVPPELHYKFAPPLITLDAIETVDAWISLGATLDPRRLIPALIRYSNLKRPKNAPNDAIRYLEFCIRNLQNKDAAIHNFLISLYATQDDESALLRFLGAGRASKGDVYYDPKYALRLCLDARRMRSCVAIFGMMGMHEEAVALALQVDLELAKTEADKVEDDDELRKKLWLMIAKHVIKQEREDSSDSGQNIRKAIAFLTETDGLLKIEDILPFFPDFTLIDDFKDAICSSLEDYNSQIEELKRDMNDATRGAESIRSDISALAQRYAIVHRDEECAICSRPLLGGVFGRGGGGGTKARRNEAAQHMAPFYVFPCTHAFHAECLTTHVLEKSDPAEREKIKSLKVKLTSLVRDEISKPLRSINSGYYPAPDDEPAQRDATNSSSPITEVTEALDNAVAGECPFCGELMIKDIMLPFIELPDEAELEDSWKLETNALLPSGISASSGI